MCNPCAIRKCNATSVALPAATVTCSGKRYSTAAPFRMERAESSACPDASNAAAPRSTADAILIPDLIQGINSHLNSISSLNHSSLLHFFTNSLPQRFPDIRLDIVLRGQSRSEEHTSELQ